MNLARTFVFVAAVAAGAASGAPRTAQAEPADAGAALQVPTNAFFGTISGTVAWPSGKNLGAPKEAAKACSKVTVRVLKKEPAAEAGGEPTVTELRAVQATGGKYPAACTYKVDNVRIRQDVFLEATFPAEDWVKCKTPEFTSAPAKNAKWTNPLQLPRSQELKAPLALGVVCSK